MKNKTENHFKMSLPAKSTNEQFARSVISAFLTQLDPTIEELCDVKTAVSEAVTNCIVHAYDESTKESKKLIYLSASISKDNRLCIKIKDNGKGIEDIQKALLPMYSGSKSDERSGMGFSIMQLFTDKLIVKSKIGKGTTVTLYKYISDNAKD